MENIDYTKQILNRLGDYVDNVWIWKCGLFFAHKVICETLQEATEAQHRKTWALAMRLAVECVNAGEVEFGHSDDYYKGFQRTTQDIAKALETLPCPPVDHTYPCPPIEATKVLDK